MSFMHNIARIKFERFQLSIYQDSLDRVKVI